MNKILSDITKFNKRIINKTKQINTFKLWKITKEVF